MTSTTSTRRRVRRNRITTVDAWIVAAIAGAAGIAGALSGAHPTAWNPADVVLTGAFAAFVAWAGASSPWWVVAGGAGGAVLAAPSPSWAVVAAIGFVVAAVIGARRLSSPPGRAFAAGATIVVLLQWGSVGFHGLTALVTGAVAVTIVLSGLQRRQYAVRRTVRQTLIGVAVVAGVAIAGAALAAVLAYGDLRDGERQLREAAAALQDGDIQTAVELLEQSEHSIGDASTALHRPWARPVLAVPVAGQHMAVAADFARDIEALSSTMAVAIGQINIDSLRVESGVIDLVAIELLGPPLSETEAALAQASTSLEARDSEWLLPPAANTVGTLTAEVDELLEVTRTAIDAVELAPSMLGRDEPRTYFVAFTTPAESRGLGGFMGTWAELSADDGRLDVTRTGQTNDLTRAMDPDPVLDGPADYVDRYGRFGAGENGEPVAVDFWSNVTMSPDFPSVTEVFAQMYPASGGTEIDGAMAIDVEAVARFLDLTGPISVAGPDGSIRLDASNAEEYLLREQYADIADDDVRDAVLEELTTRLIEEVFEGDLAGPSVLARTLAPAMNDGGLVIWSRDPADQSLISDLGIGGALPTPRSDGFAVASNNAGANKLDAYLKRNIAYDAVVDETTGEIDAAATIRLVNSAPPGLPDDAQGNPFGLPPGTNRMYVSVYSPWTLTAAALDGEQTGMEPATELGWNVYSRFVDIPPGGEVELRLGFEGTLPIGETYELVLRSQPLAFPDVVRVDVASTAGEVLHSSHQVRSGVEVVGDG